MMLSVPIKEPNHESTNVIIIVDAIINPCFYYSAI